MYNMHLISVEPPPTIGFKVRSVRVKQAKPMEYSFKGGTSFFKMKWSYYVSVCLCAFILKICIYHTIVSPKEASIPLFT